MRSRLLRLLVIAALGLLCLTASASARQIHQYFYSGESFTGADAEGGAFGTSPGAVAVDDAAQRVLVVSDPSGTNSPVYVSRFTTLGNASPFSGIEATSFQLPVESASRPDIAVDNSGTATQGNFYVAAGEIYGYAADGTPLSGFPTGSGCGVAVAPSGDVWVAEGSSNGAYREYEPDGAPTGRALFLGVKNGGCSIAVDGEGNLYLGEANHLVKYNSALERIGRIAYLDSATATPVEIDRGEEALLVRSGTELTANTILQYDLLGNPITPFGGPDPSHFSYPGLDDTQDIAIDPTTHDLYARDRSVVDIFERDPLTVTIPTVSGSPASEISGTTATLNATIDADGVDTTECHFEWGTSSAYGNSAPCEEDGVPANIFSAGSGSHQISATIAGLAKGTTYHFRIVAENGNELTAPGRDIEFNAAEPPLIPDASPDHITSDSARISFQINPNGSATSYHVEVGTDTEYGKSFPVPDAQPAGLREAETILKAQAETQEISGLSPDTTYHARVVAVNAAGERKGADVTFHTFAPVSAADSCANAHVRQQTSSSHLLDCRAYELVSAPDTGGYDVRSDLSQGVTPLPAYPEATDRVLYSMQSGTIPGIAGNPTNRGADPYIASRGADGWTTSYVGLPANDPSASGPFGSPLLAADASLGDFAFGGPELCSPCFPDGSSGVPIRLPDGDLVQGMAGSIPVADPQPAGEVVEPISADGTHFVFGSEQEFVPGANNDGSDVTIYDRNLTTDQTQIVSVDHGAPIQNGTGVAELAISRDGSRILVGKLVSSEGETKYWHLFMHVGTSITSIDLTPEATDGVIFDGMSEDGTKVYFTTRDALTTATDQDTDTSADIYRADVSSSSATLTRVSTGTGGTGNTDSCNPAANSAREHWNTLGSVANCDAVAVGGGGGVASASGAIYFLSPEQLDGSEGVAGAPNLYFAQPGSPPQFVVTLESSANEPLKSKVHVLQHTVGTFSYPEGIAIDRPTGSTYVLDTVANSNGSTPGAYVKKFDASGQLDTSFGKEGKLEGTPLGPFLEAGEGPTLPVGVATQLAVDENPASSSYRDLYVPDFGNRAIDKFGPSGNFISQFSLGTNIPTGVAVDPANSNIFVSTLGKKIFTYNSNGGAVAPVSFKVSATPLGVAVDSSGNSYVVAGSTKAGVYSANLSVYDPSGNLVKVLDSNNPNGVAVDAADDHVYIDEANRVVELESSGAQVGEPLGAELLSKSVSLGVDSGQLSISNPGAGDVLLYSAPIVPPDAGYDNPLVLDSVSAPERRDSSDFQVSPSGDYAAFPSAEALTGFDSNGKLQIFRYAAEATNQIACASCDQTGARPATDTRLSPYGLNLTDDGRIFFTSGEPLALGDANERTDAYEWENGTQQLISTGTSTSDSTLLSVSSDGKNAFFFTRQKLVPEDRNGDLVRLYTARENGGFGYGPPEFQCAASDECHGPGSPEPSPVSIPTTTSVPLQPQSEKVACKRGTVKRHGRCVKAHVKKHHRDKHHRRTPRGKLGGGKGR